MDYGRKISSMSFLLRWFGFTFEVAQPNKQYLARVSAYERMCGGRLASDVGVVYGIIAWDERVAPIIGCEVSHLRGTLEGVMWQFRHDASCGCGGCLTRLRNDWEAWQQKKAADDPAKKVPH